MDVIKYLKSEGYTEIKEIPGVGICGLRSFIFTTGLIIGMNEIGYFGRYCYKTSREASDALKSWDGSGDPPGNWIIRPISTKNKSSILNIHHWG